MLVVCVAWLLCYKKQKLVLTVGKVGYAYYMWIA